MKHTIVMQQITKAGLLAGVGFPSGMYWGQSWGRGSDLSHRRFLDEVNHSHEGPPPSTGSNTPWSMCFEGSRRFAEGHFFGEKTE